MYGHIKNPWMWSGKPEIDALKKRELDYARSLKNNNQDAFEDLLDDYLKNIYQEELDKETEIKRLLNLLSTNIPSDEFDFGPNNKLHHESLSTFNTLLDPSNQISEAASKNDVIAKLSAQLSGTEAPNKGVYEDPNSDEKFNIDGRSKTTAELTKEEVEFFEGMAIVKYNVMMTYVRSKDKQEKRYKGIKKENKQRDEAANAEHAARMEALAKQQRQELEKALARASRRHKKKGG